MNIFKGVVFFIGLFVLSRLIPHAPNFTPIIASVIFLPFIIKSKFGLGLPILVMLISDLIIGFHSAMFWVYGAFILIGLMAYIFYRPSFSRVLSLSIISPTIFFLITNFGVWIGSSLYETNLTGLLTAYTFALPFFANSLFASVLFSLSFFSIFKLVTRRDPLVS